MRHFIRDFLIRWAAAVVAVALFSGAALAHDEERSTLNLQVENDLFGDGSDKNYTNGMRLSYTHKPAGAHSLPPSPPVQVPALLTPLFGETFAPCGFYTMLTDFGSWKDHCRYGASIAQAMFTPENIETSRFDDIRKDRPYAGWFYVGLSAIDEVCDQGMRPLKQGKSCQKPVSFLGTQLNRDTLEIVELDLGVVGPAALTDRTQIWWHQVINSPRPNGWQFQLENEPGVVLNYERKWRFSYRRGDAPPENILDYIDLTPNAGVALGNVYTFGNAGVTLRVGNDLHKDYGPPRIRPSLSGSDFFEPENNFSGYIFAGYEGRVVGRNIFLDGNTFRDSHSVDRRYVVGDFQVGAVVMFKRVRMGFTKVFRTREFDEQKGTTEFGSFNLSVAF